MFLAAFTYENSLLIFQSSFRLESRVSGRGLKNVQKYMAPFNMLNEISYLLVQGEILEVLMTTEERAIQEIITKVSTRVLRLRSGFLENFTKVVLENHVNVANCQKFEEVNVDYLTGNSLILLFRATIQSWQHCKVNS